MISTFVTFSLLLCTAWARGAEAEGIQELKILWAEWAPADYLQTVGDLYEEETGIKVTVVQEPWATYSDKFYGDMDAGNPEGLDMVVGDSQWLGTSYAKGLYVDLTDFLTETGMAASVPPLALKYYSEYPAGEGRYWAYPTEGDAIGWVYRKDLFEDPEEMKAFEAKYGRPLAVPETLAELKDIAEFFTRPDEDLYGVAVYVSEDYDAITMGFETALFSYSGEWKTLTHKSAIGDLPSSRDALQFYKDLYDCCQTNSSVDADYVHMEDLFFSGRTAMIMHYFAMMDPIYTSKNPYLNSTGYFVNPAGPTGDRFTSLGGQGTSILATISPERQEASKEFLKWFGSEETQQKWADAGGLTANTKVMASESFLSSKPFHQAYAESLPIVKDFWNIPSYLELLNVSQTELYNYVVKGERTAEETAKSIATQQDLILEENLKDWVEPSTQNDNATVTGTSAGERASLHIGFFVTALLILVVPIRC